MAGAASRCHAPTQRPPCCAGLSRLTSSSVTTRTCSAQTYPASTRQAACSGLGAGRVAATIPHHTVTQPQLYCPQSEIRVTVDGQIVRFGHQPHPDREQKDEKEMVGGGGGRDWADTWPLVGAPSAPSCPCALALLCCNRYLCAHPPCAAGHLPPRRTRQLFPRPRAEAAGECRLREHKRQGTQGGGCTAGQLFLFIVPASCL